MKLKKIKNEFKNKYRREYENGLKKMVVLFYGWNAIDAEKPTLRKIRINDLKHLTLKYTNASQNKDFCSYIQHEQNWYVFFLLPRTIIFIGEIRLILIIFYLLGPNTKHVVIFDIYCTPTQHTHTHTYILTRTPILNETCNCLYSSQWLAKRFYGNIF